MNGASVCHVLRKHNLDKRQQSLARGSYLFALSRTHLNSRRVSAVSVVSG